MGNYLVPNNKKPNIIGIKCSMIFDELLKWRNSLIFEGIDCKEVEIWADNALFSSFMRSLLTAGISQIEMKYKEKNDYEGFDFCKIGLFEHNNIEDWDSNEIVMNINVYCKE